MPTDPDGLEAELSGHGLMSRGCFNFGVSEDAPASLSGKPAKSAVLIGQAGAANWPHFQAWLTSQRPKPENPLDTWSKTVINAVAASVSARAVFPSDKPWLPFQQWAVRAEGPKPSPLGILVHPEYGLWHAYRGAFLFDEPLDIDKKPTSSHPCDNCVEKPCLSTCPVNAFQPGQFDGAGCVGHVTGDSGALCRNRGCLARNACPVGVEYRYPSEVQAFHMAAFLANNPPN